MSYLRRVERQRPVNQIVELRRKVRKAAARRAGLAYTAHVIKDDFARKAFGASAQSLR